MSSPWSQYSPLETLLLFQSLASHGVEPPAFARISDLLLSNASVRDAPAYDSRRLSPDALRDLYLVLLKEEARGEQQDASDHETPGQNGDTSPSRKRKAHSPSLPTVQDAAQHAHLLPHLVAKLYMRYRRHAVEEIRAEERRYDQLKREIEDIERGDWDQHLREASKNGVNGQSVPLESAAQAVPIHEHQARTAASHSPTVPQAPPSAASSQNPGSRRQSTKIEALINPAPSMPSSGTASPQKTPLQSPMQPTAGFPPTQQRKLSQPLQPNQRLPQPHTAASVYQLSSPYAPTHPVAASGHGSPPSQSPKVQNATLNGRPGSRPVVLPPPPGMPFPPPGVQVPSMPETGGPFRPPSGSPHQYPQPFPPSGQQSPAGPVPSNMQQAPRPFYPPYQQPQYPPQHPPQHPQHPQHPQQHPQQHPPQQQQPMYYPPHQGGYMLPPFQVTPQDPVRAHQEQQRAMQQTAPSQPRPSPRAPAPTPTRPQPPYVHTPGQPHTLPPPHLMARPYPRTPRPPPLLIGTPLGSWKRGLPQPIGAVVPESNPAPVSPISPPGSPIMKRESKATKKKAESAKSKDMLAPESTGRARGGRKPARKARAGSTASSAVTAGSVRGRTRSQSVASHAEEGVDMKADPDTPAGTVESDVHSTTEQATPSGARTRRRAGTLQSTTSQSHEKTNKRKRGTREPSEPADEPSPRDPIPSARDDTTGPPTTVIASRNFNRMSVPVMNDITSHKHASLFSNPVKAKDAEGYYDIIRRPQDLKSIRAAITTGSRNVAAATASTADNTPSAASPMPSGPQQAPSTPNASAAAFTSASSGGTHIALPIAEDLVPPRGIVNSAQLEKELMRMFANAVMFNSGDEGVVGDAVEMAKDVEASVANWRAAERTNMEVSQMVEDEGDGVGVGKRRKV